MSTQKQQRNSSIEFLKIIALFFIVLCHSLPLYKYGGTTELEGYINLGQSTTSLQTLVLIVFSHLGQIGNAIFIVSSAYFLLENDKVKKEKIAQYIIDTFCVSAIYLFVFIVIKGNLPLSYIASSILPITFNFYWFITCYIILYAIHPWLNQIIQKLEKAQLFSVCLCMFVLYCVVSYILNGKYYYSHLVGFIVYYFFMGYAKLYLPALSSNKKQNIKILLFCICGFIGLIIVANYLGTRVSAANGLVGVLERFVNPFIVGMAFSAFNLCNLKQSSNRLINRVSSTSLLVFVISNNVIVCSYLKPVVFEYIYKHFSYSYIALICILFAIITFILSVLLAIAYMKTIQRVVLKGCGWLVSRCNSLIFKFYYFVDNIEQKIGRGCNERSVHLLPLFNLHDLSTYRTELMGISALWVVLCHARQHCVLPSIIHTFVGLGNTCVDVFLILGGLGMYYSLNSARTKDISLVSWYKKRFVRVIVPYLIAAIPFYIWFCIYNKYGIGRFFYHLSGLSFWGEHEGMWYVDLLIPLYFITPLIGKLIDKAKHRLVPTSILICLILAISAAPISDYISKPSVQAVVMNIQSVLCRVVGYVFGYFCGEYVRKGKQISFLVIPVSLIIYILFQKLPMLKNIYSGWLLACFLMFVLCVVIKIIQKTKIVPVLKWLGERSLELYLANCILVPLLFTFSWKFGSIDLSRGNYFYYFMVLILNIPLAQIIYFLKRKVTLKKDIS